VKLEFTFYPSSEAANAFLDKLCPGNLFQNPNRAPTADVINKRKACFNSTISDLLIAHHLTSDGYCYRPMEDGSFTQERFGANIFKKVKEVITEKKLCRLEEGYWTAKNPIASRLFLFDEIAQKAEEYSIYKDNLLEHFAFHKVQHVIRAKYPKRKLDKGKTSDAKSVPHKEIQKCPEYPYLEKQIFWINDYLLSNHSIKGCSFTGFYRAFSDFKKPASSPNGKRDALFAGGRLYAQAGSYQTLKPKKRLKLEIDGEPVVEIDIKASHLSLAIFSIMGMTNATLSDFPQYDFSTSKIDLYEVEGIPRILAKQCSVQLVSNGFKSSQWGRKFKEDIVRNSEIDLADFRFIDVKGALFEKHPLLNSPTAKDIDWGFLQRRESDALIATVTRLAHEYAIPAYPVHDSLIVKLKDIELAEHVLSDCFFSHIGYRPHLERKTDRD